MHNYDEAAQIRQNLTPQSRINFKGMRMSFDEFRREFAHDDLELALDVIEILIRKGSIKLDNGMSRSGSTDKICRICDIEMDSSNMTSIGKSGANDMAILRCRICGSMYDQGEGKFIRNLSYIQKLESGEAFTFINAWRNYLEKLGKSQQEASEQDMQNFKNKIMNMRNV